jgi:hypothetical protein
MGLFKRKPKTEPQAEDKVQKLINDINDLDENELDRFLEHMSDISEDIDDEEGEDENEGKEETDMTQDEKQIEKAKDDIAEKGADSQTEKDRIDESVAEQEKADGDEDSQDAKDRVDESEGAEKADEERHETSQDVRLERIENAVLKLVEMLTPKEGNAAEEAAKEIYGLGNGVFSDTKETKEEKAMSKEDIARTINKIMR